MISLPSLFIRLLRLYFPNEISRFHKIDLAFLGFHSILIY